MEEYYISDKIIDSKYNVIQDVSHLGLVVLYKKTLEVKNIYSITNSIMKEHASQVSSSSSNHIHSPTYNQFSQMFTYMPTMLSASQSATPTPTPTPMYSYYHWTY
jgi:hypothetical protein